MARKVIDVGAPAYMGQYSALMTILLAFFIMMLAMGLSDKQDAGYVGSGIGLIKNSFGLEGGLGLGQYTQYGKGGSHATNPVSDKDKDKQVDGVHKSLSNGEGGPGNLDQKLDEQNTNQYIRLELPFEFPELSDKITPEMSEYLKKVGIGFALFDYKLDIRSFSLESRDDEVNRTIALKRSAQIIRYLNMISDVPFSRMEATGYNSTNYFKISEEKLAEKKKQGTYFYIFVNLTQKNTDEKQTEK